MPIILGQDNRVERRVVLPQNHGVEARDLRAFPLPPGTDLRLLNVVVADLRANGYVIDYEIHREQLVDWDKTRTMNDRGEELYGSGDTVLHFVRGGMSIKAVVNGRAVLLRPQDFRGGRNSMRFALTGRL